MITIHEVSKLAGVSVQTLHHYPLFSYFALSSARTC